MLENSLETSELLISLMGILLEVDDESQLAALNETTISDNNGGRIIL